MISRLLSFFDIKAPTGAYLLLLTGHGTCYLATMIRRFAMRRFAILTCLLLMSLAMPHAAPAQGGPAAVGVAPVDMRIVSETVPVFAQITTARDGAVASRVAGNVEQVHVLTGDRVAKGDLLVELDRELLEILEAQSEAETAEATAGIESARVQVDRTQKAFDRIEALRESSSFSQGRFDEAQSDMLNARSELVRARARLKSSEAQLAETRYQLARSQIIAPFSGVVIEVNTIPGAFIQAGSPVVRLLDTDAIEVEAGVPSRYASWLEPGQEVRASVETGQEITLKVRAVLPLEDPATRTRAVRFTGSDLGNIGRAAVGQSLTVQIAVGEAREVLAVPKDALVQAANGWTVYVAEDGKAQPRNVQIGVALGGRYEVLSGLEQGDLVVVRGNERLRPGQDIAPSRQDES